MKPCASIVTVAFVAWFASACERATSSREPEPEATREPEAAREPEAKPGVKRELVVIDAGSSGTRARVFSGELSRPDTLAAVVTTECSFDVPLATNIEGVIAGWECVRPKLSDPAGTPVLVYATAGMRSLAELDPQAAVELHAEVVRALEQRGVEQVESRTIEGSDEALYAWIAINHQEQRLSGEPTVTIAEFGGASIQIAYEIEMGVEADMPELQTLHLGGVPHRIYARSYLHCGVNEARVELAGSTCFAPDCASAMTCAAQLPVGASGTGDVACERHVEERLRGDAASCKAVVDPPPKLPGQPVRVISILRSVFETLDSVHAGAVDLGRARARAQEVCASQWAGLEALLPSAPEPFRATTCFNATYALLVLDAWGLAEGDPRPSVSEADDSWAWGVARLWIEGVER